MMNNNDMEFSEEILKEIYEREAKIMNPDYIPHEELVINNK